MARMEQGLSRGNTVCFVSRGGWTRMVFRYSTGQGCFRKIFEVLMAVDSNVTTCFLSNSYCRKD